MAEKRRDYAGCETFDVGRKQAVRLFHGDSAEYWYSPNHEYLIVGAACSFGDVSKIGEIYVCETYEQAMSEVSRYLVDDAAALRNPHSFDGMMGIAWEYEIWHLVDDSELWDEWELKVRTFKDLARFSFYDTRYYNHKDVHYLREWVGVCRAVERDTRIITEVERRFIMAHRFDFEFEDMNYTFLHMSGTLYDLTYRYKTTVTVRRFVDKVDYQGWMIRHMDLLDECPHFVFCFSYDHRGVYAYEDPVSDDGEVPMGDLGWIASVLGLDYELADIPSGASGEGIPGGPLDEDIVF